MVPERVFMFSKVGFRSFLTLAGTAILLSFPMLCDNGTGPSDPPGPLELLYPKGGNNQSFKVGDTVTIVWSIHNQNLVQSVGMSYSLDGGETVTTMQLIHNKSVIYPDTSFRWVIEGRHVSKRFVLIIWEYDGQCLTGLSCDDRPYDKSAPFKISQ